MSNTVVSNTNFPPNNFSLEDFPDYISEFEDTTRSHPYAKIGSLIKKRWRIICQLGEGHFSDVYCVYDYKARAFRSLKIMPVLKSSYQAMIDNEKKIFDLLRDKGHHENVVHVYNKFICRIRRQKFQCIVMELLGINLLKYIEDYYPTGIPENIVKLIAKDCFKGLDCIHSLGAIHTDIKLENIVVKPSGYCIQKFGIEMWTKYESILGPCSLILPPPKLADRSISFVVIDLGSVVFPTEEPRYSTIPISTRQYRSPESILGWRYNENTSQDKQTVDIWFIDIWSMVCMLFELRFNEFLFEPHESPIYSRDEDHLVLIRELLGEIPIELINKGAYSHEIFIDGTNEFIHIKKHNPWALYNVLIEKYRQTKSSAQDLSDFLLPMLSLDPYNRPTARECLESKWLN